MGRALVLNATFEPLCVVSARRALVLVLKQKAELVHQDGGSYHSERMTVPIPSVIRLKYFVRVPYRARASLSRRAVFVRDSFQCQYCGEGAENVDHVIPRSRGGTHTWENVVAACKACNTRKENRLPAEAGMKLRSKPAAPREKIWIIVAVGRVDPKWEPYLNGGHSHTPAQPAAAPA
ncbi:MAG TPA: HNH endonuclease [Actinomycetota bacterium]|nr:HNH endonuclease [Actinomycetota bacterium]